MAQQPKSKYPIEIIPDPDFISRCCFAVNGIRLDPATDFKFSAADHDEHPLTISVDWRKYAVERYEVDQRGEYLAKVKNDRNRRNKRSGKLTYVGYRTAMAQTIRAIRTERDFFFSVTHAPSNISRAHTHIAIEHANHPNAQALMRNDRSELMNRLIEEMPMDEALPS